MQLKDVTPIIKAILEERDKIPRIIDKERYIPNPQPYHDGNLIRGGIRKALRIIEQAPVVDAMPRWISVEERLPEGEDPVLILVKETEHYGLHKEKSKVYYCQYLAYWDDEEWYTTWCNGCRKITDTANEPNADDYEVTHWMPLPEPPKEESTC